MPYALFLGHRQLSKAHSTREAAMTEAYERGVVLRSGHDLPDSGPVRFSHRLAEGYSIKEVE